jgi:hypothetical protein
MLCMRWGGSIVGTCEVGFPELAEDDTPSSIAEVHGGILTGVRRRSDSRKNPDLYATRARKPAIRRQGHSCAFYGGRHDRAPGAERRDECACMKFQEPWGACECALREERQRVSIDRIAQHLAGVRGTPVTIEALYEMRPKTTKQQACQRHAIHLTLDHEGKLRWKDRCEDNAVQVARVIGYDDALAPGKAFQPFYTEGHPGEREECAGHGARYSAPALHPGNNED